MGIYNGVWVHLYRRYISGEIDQSEERKLLPDSGDVNVLTPTPGTKGYTELDKDSVNG